jgi:NAD(P)-dependent dehydrogenase (short-subunit alcohol dehydrogenase family)
MDTLDRSSFKPSQMGDKTVLITGANRGIGRALLEEALQRGARLVYAGTRTEFTHADQRVVPLQLDITNKEQIQTAVSKVPSLDMLINNAGISVQDNLDERTLIEHHLSVNLFGTYNMIQAFLPLLIRSKGAIVNNLSLLSLAPLPLVASYCISKAAALSLTQSYRVLLAHHGIRVHGVLTGPVDTDMNHGLVIPVPMAAPALVAQAIFDGVDHLDEDIFPDPLSRTLADSWNNGVIKLFEKQVAGMAT